MRSKILAAALLVLVLAAAVPHTAAAQQPPKTPAQSEFVPIETLPAQEQIPAARLVMTAAHALEESAGRRALVTMCIGVGQGLSIALERI